MDGVEFGAEPGVKVALAGAAMEEDNPEHNSTGKRKGGDVSRSARDKVGKHSSAGAGAAAGTGSSETPERNTAGVGEQERLGANAQSGTSISLGQRGLGLAGGPWQRRGDGWARERMSRACTRKCARQTA
ncbi:hypothetical protein FRC10_010674 [Ceratobasidium sp. 414]|nr:hypothetical protein FRC10_010674 [Ceratobasidium sp. 414]